MQSEFRLPSLKKLKGEQVDLWNQNQIKSYPNFKSLMQSHHDESGFC